MKGGLAFAFHKLKTLLDSLPFRIFVVNDS